MLRPQARSRILKKPSRTPGSDRARKERRTRRDRGLVRRRGTRRPEEQDHPALGQARHPAQRSQRSANRLRLYLRRDLSQGRQGRGARHATLQYRGDESPPRRNRNADCARRARRPSCRPGRLIVPSNITLIPFPAKCPELNPQKNIWQFMRENWLSNRIFKSFDDIVDHCCDAWNKLIDQPWRIMSIGMREWAHRV